MKDWFLVLVGSAIGISIACAVTLGSFVALAVATTIF